MAKKNKPVLWICAACGEQFTAWAQVGRHDPSHPRIVTVVQQAEMSDGGQ